LAGQGVEALLADLERARAKVKPPEGIGLPLASAFECAFRRLAEPDQAAYARLAVFRAGFGLADALAVAGLTPEQAQRMQSAGLLQVEQGRCSLTDPIRRLAKVKMETEAGARFRAGIAHRDHYLNLLKDHAAELNGGPQKAEMILRLDQDFPNVREAWRRACETEALDLLAAASTPLGQYFDFRNRNREGVALYGLAIERFEANGRSRALCELFMQRASSMTYFGLADESRHLLGLALDYWRSIGDRNKEAIALTHLANVAGSAGDFEAQVSRATEALALWAGLGDVKGTAWARTHQAVGHLRLGRLREARALAEQAMAEYQQQGDLTGKLWVMGVLAEAAFTQGDIEAARQSCYSTLEQARPLEAHWALAAAYMQLATIAELQSSYREARHFLERAREEYAGLGREAQMAFNLRNLLSQVHMALGHYADAQGLLARNLDPARPPENSQDLGWPMNLLAQLRNLQGEFKLAQEICEQGLADARLAADGGAWFKENLADALLQQGQHAKALALLQESLALAEANGRLRSMAWGHNRVGLALLAMHRYALAKEHLLKALHLHERLAEAQGRVADELGLARVERLSGDLERAAGMAEAAVHAYMGFGMPRGIAIASLELAACFSGLGQMDLAQEACSVALRQAYNVGAWPVALRALAGLAELRALDGMQGPVVQALAAFQQQEACDADTRARAQALMAGLLKAMGAKACAAAREHGKDGDLARAAALLGVALPHPDPAKA
jgi:tetratricopeptide (TPR) repeat protein